MEVAALLFHGMPCLNGRCASWKDGSIEGALKLLGRDGVTGVGESDRSLISNLYEKSESQGRYIVCVFSHWWVGDGGPSKSWAAMISKAIFALGIWLTIAH